MYCSDVVWLGQNTLFRRLLALSRFAAKSPVLEAQVGSTALILDPPPVISMQKTPVTISPCCAPDFTIVDCVTDSRSTDDDSGEATWIYWLHSALNWLGTRRFLRGKI
jgi:hypothetical protein